MMSPAEDQLFLNICGDEKSSAFVKKHVKTQQGQKSWKKRGEKRRSDSLKEEEEEEERRHPIKQRRLKQEAVASLAGQQVTNQKPQERKEEVGGQETGRGGIKTSCLFKNNPDIPEVQKLVVSHLKEKIFTSDSFSELDLHPHLVATLNKVLNVTTLTSVQKSTIPVLLSGKDAVVRSQTGSGKTLSYAVPMVQSLQAVQPRVSRSDGPLALIIVPTRELAMQTFSAFQKLLKPFTWIVPGVLMGGEKRKSEKARLRKGINILVSTPGRLVDHIKNTLSISFSSVRWLILDEADRTLDLGFEKDLTVILNSLNSTGPKRQNVLLSATLTNSVTRLADVCLNDPVSIHVSGSASSDLISTNDTSDCQPASQSESFAVPEALKQYVVVVPSKIRLVCLATFILDKCKFSSKDKVVVFSSSCEAVEFLHSIFTAVLSANHQLTFLRLHGNMKQEERSEVFQEFSASSSGVLLCTDVAARGLDLPQVSWIVQYTPPTSTAEYVHRVGRTARIGSKGNSLLFLTPAETSFINELANHNISLSEMKVLDILATLMMDDTYKGRGKYHSKTSSRSRQQDIQERATVLQTHFENFVHSNVESLKAAKTALQSFLRAYTTYPAHLKHIFHIRSLHLGHAAKSFGLRDAPQGLSSATSSKKNKSQSKKQTRSPVKNQKTGKKKFYPGQREVSLIRSEVSSGLDATDTAKKRKKKRKSVQLGE